MLPNWLYGKSLRKLQEILNSGGQAAEDVSYSNTESGLEAANVQAAIDELTEDAKKITAPFKIAKTDCYCENDTTIHYYTPTAIAGYNPIGIVGLSAIADVAAITDLYEYRLFRTENNNSRIQLGWKTALPTTKGVRVMILYVSEKSGLSIVSQ